MKDNVVDHNGSSFDDFLEEQGITDEVDARAVKAVLAMQLEKSMREQGLVHFSCRRSQ